MAEAEEAPPTSSSSSLPGVTVLCSKTRDLTGEQHVVSKCPPPAFTTRAEMHEAIEYFRQCGISLSYAVGVRSDKSTLVSDGVKIDAETLLRDTKHNMLNSHMYMMPMEDGIAFIGKTDKGSIYAPTIEFMAREELIRVGEMIHDATLHVYKMPASQPCLIGEMKEQTHIIYAMMQTHPGLFLTYKMMAMINADIIMELMIKSDTCNVKGSTKHACTTAKFKILAVDGKYKRPVNSEENTRVARYVTDGRDGMLIHDADNEIFTYVEPESIKQLITPIGTLATRPLQCSPTRVRMVRKDAIVDLFKNEFTNERAKTLLKHIYEF